MCVHYPKIRFLLLEGGKGLDGYFVLAGEAEDVSLGGQRGQQRPARRAEVHVGLEGGERRHPDDGALFLN